MTAAFEKNKVWCRFVRFDGVRRRIHVPTGTRFGRWTLLEESNKWRDRPLCLCDCGTQRRVVTRTLLRQLSQSCRGEKHPELRATTFTERTGHRYGRLTVISRAPSRKSIRKDKKQTASTAMWLCRCDCGGEKTVAGTSLGKGYTRSCGCLSKEYLRSDKNKKHAYWKPPGHPQRRIIIKGYKASAIKRGLCWELTDAEFFALCARGCHYCGATPENTCRTSGNGEFIYSGIDRVDNGRGYTVDNTVPCCSICNRAKHALKLEAFEAWVNRLVNFRSKAVPV